MIEYFFVPFVFLFGAALGSFASVWVDRDNRDEKFIKGRSYCEKCKHVLDGKDMVPVFSYIFLRGKCRYCKHDIPWGLFAAEVGFGLSFAFSYLLFINQKLANMGFMTISSIVAICIFVFLLFMLLLIFLSDLKFMMISDHQFYLLGAIYLFGYIFYYLSPTPLLDMLYSDIFSHLIGAATMLVFFGSIVIISREKLMGQGDIYLAGLLGLMLGWELALVMWFIAFLSGATIGLLLISLNLKKIQSAVPFGPFLIVAAYFSYFFGKPLIDLYLYSLGF